MRDEVEIARAPGDRAWLAAPGPLEHHDDNDQAVHLWHDAEQFFNTSAWSAGPEEEADMDACSDCTVGLSGDEDVLPDDEVLDADTTAEAYHQGKDLQVLCAQRDVLSSRGLCQCGIWCCMEVHMSCT